MKKLQFDARRQLILVLVNINLKIPFLFKWFIWLSLRRVWDSKMCINQVELRQPRLGSFLWTFRRRHNFLWGLWTSIRSGTSAQLRRGQSTLSHRCVIALVCRNNLCRLSRSNHVKFLGLCNTIAEVSNL